MLLQVILGLILTLLALIGFLFNFYIVLALVLTKQVQVPNLFKSLFATDLEAKQPPAAAPGSQQQHLDHPLPLHLLALHLHRIPCCWHHCLSGGHWNHRRSQRFRNNHYFDPLQLVQVHGFFLHVTNPLIVWNLAGIHLDRFVAISQPLRFLTDDLEEVECDCISGTRAS